MPTEPHRPVTPAPLASPRATVYFYALWAGFCVVFLLVNRLTCLSTLPWTDEVMQVDPGVNLWLGHGWTSTAWQSQSGHEFWAANNPLFSLLIYLWLGLAGFSEVATRSFNYVFVLALAWLVADTAWRAGWVRSRAAEALIALLIVADGAVTYVYRFGRADLATLFVVALVARAFALGRSPTRRRALLFLAGTGLLAVGLQSIPYVVLLFVLARIASGRWSAAELGAVGAGCATGGVLLAALFAAHHVLPAFIAQTFASGYNIVGAAVQAAVFRDRVAVGRFTDVLYALMPWEVLRVVARDHGSALLIGFALAAYALTRAAAARRAAGLCVVAGILVPYGMLAAGRYPVYYAWMGAVPVAVLFVCLLEHLYRAPARGWFRAGCAAALVAFAVGLPLALWHETTRTPPDRYARLAAGFADTVRPADVIYGDPVLYYLAKRGGYPFYSVTYAGGRGYRTMAEAERSAITLALVTRPQVTQTRAKLGGEWLEAGPPLDVPGVEPLVVLRRAGH